MALTDTGEVNQMAVPLESGVTCGQALVKLLANYGVDTVFGIPGVHTLELYRGLPGSPIRHVLARHEQGAGFMADGYARISGRPGVMHRIPHFPDLQAPVHRHLPVAESGDLLATNEIDNIRCGIGGRAGP